MASNSNIYAFDIVAAAEAGKRWLARRSIHRKWDRLKSAPLLSEFETPDRILRRAQRLESKFALQSGNSNRDILVESLSESSSRDSFRSKNFNDETTLERVINRTRDFQFTAFLEQAIYVANAVCRIKTQLADGRVSFGTGFLVSANLILTNHHVLPNIDTAMRSIAEFGYQQDRSGNTAAPKPFSLDPIRLFLSNKELDFALVAVDRRRPYPSLPWVWCPMIKDLGKIITTEHINIIQHPRGEVKQVVIRENRLLDSFEGKEIVLHYEADTEPGSSGSPVFNDQWEVVALHHSGVPRSDSEGRMLKKDGKIWMKGDDPNDIDWVANEGIRTSKIVEAVESQSLRGETRDLQQEFLAAVPPDLATAIPTNPATHTSRTSTSPTISTLNRRATPVPRPTLPQKPVPLTNTRQITMHDEQPHSNGTTLRYTIPIHIEITLGDPIPKGENLSSAHLQSTSKLNDSAFPSVEILEKITPAPDYDNRPGYDANFLGFDVPFPKLTVSTRPQAYALAGKSGDKKYLIDYYHYSLIFNKTRKLAFVSGVNYDPTAEFQHQRDKGGDKWFYDPRVTPTAETQAGDELYAANPLDRGHLVRRADSAWGATAEEAKLANDDTFHFTNCSPQHEITNQGKRDKAPVGLVLWGELEEYIASQGKETAQRLSIFNGPIFRDNDRIYRGVKLPKQFWKLIVFQSETGNPTAAAFKLTQAKLIQGLEEAFEFDEYQTVQLSVKQLEADTGLNFGKIAAWDAIDNESAQESFADGSNVIVLTQLKDVVLGS